MPPSDLTGYMKRPERVIAEERADILAKVGYKVASTIEQAQIVKSKYEKRGCYGLISRNNRVFKWASDS
jgi:hypothetical protein